MLSSHLVFFHVTNSITRLHSAPESAGTLNPSRIENISTELQRYLARKQVLVDHSSLHSSSQKCFNAKLLRSRAHTTQWWSESCTCAVDFSVEMDTAPVKAESFRRQALQRLFSYRIHLYDMRNCSLDHFDSIWIHHSRWAAVRQKKSSERSKGAPLRYIYTSLPTITAVDWADASDTLRTRFKTRYMLVTYETIEVLRDEWIGHENLPLKSTLESSSSAQPILLFIHPSPASHPAVHGPADIFHAPSPVTDIFLL